MKTERLEMYTDKLSVRLNNALKIYSHFAQRKKSYQIRKSKVAYTMCAPETSQSASLPVPRYAA